MRAGRPATCRAGAAADQRLGVEPTPPLRKKLMPKACPMVPRRHRPDRRRRRTAASTTIPASRNRKKAVMCPKAASTTTPNRTAASAARLGTRPGLRSSGWTRSLRLRFCISTNTYSSWLLVHRLPGWPEPGNWRAGWHDLAALIAWLANPATTCPRLQHRAPAAVWPLPALEPEAALRMLGWNGCGLSPAGRNAAPKVDTEAK